jgi:surface antigen
MNMANNRLMTGALGILLTVAAVNTAPAQMGPHESQGTAVGALFGGLIGGAIGGGAGRAIVGSLAGAAVGGFIGNRIGASLDEQDRIALDHATRNAFISGRSQHFARRAGAHGRVVVLNSNRVDGKPCRTVKQEVVLKNGNVLDDTVSACRGPHGWQV